MKTPPPGTKVRMTADSKEDMLDNGSHRHIWEFGDCTGIVIGPMFENGEGDEVDVRWQPSNLRYGYSVKHLDVVEEDAVMNPKAVCVLIRESNSPDSKILGVARRDDPNAWGMPGGKVDIGESPINAAIRELKEETGIIVNKWDLVEVFSTECGPGKDGITFDSTAYEAISWTGCPKQGDAGPVKFVEQQVLFDGPFGEYNKVWLGIVNETEISESMFRYLARTKPGKLYEWIIGDSSHLTHQYKVRAIMALTSIPNIEIAFDMCISIFNDINVDLKTKAVVSDMCVEILDEKYPDTYSEVLEELVEKYSEYS